MEHFWVRTMTERHGNLWERERVREIERYVKSYLFDMSERERENVYWKLGKAESDIVEGVGER